MHESTSLQPSGDLQQIENEENQQREISSNTAGNTISLVSELFELNPPYYQMGSISLPKDTPPPYSSTTKLPPPLSICASVEFVAPTPPPSYAQIYGGSFISPIAAIRSSNYTIQVGRTWETHPQSAFCSRCNEMVVTSVYTEDTRCAHITSFVLCVLMCWPFCLLPYCMKTCKKTTHNCPFCQSVLGESPHI